MAQGKTSRRHTGDTAVIGAGTRIRGRVTGDGDLVVDGSLEGEVSVRGNFSVGESGSVTSNLDANDVTVLGTLEGDILAKGQVRIGANAKVRGDVRGAAFSLENGARFAGRIECEFDLPSELESMGERTTSVRRK
ncbi:MAG: polymer-forming cytoskeletal protein [Polyangiaceae bacterium]